MKLPHPQPPPDLAGKVVEHYKSPLFVEYVDGAGYFSSLNGDLKRLLEMDDTHEFAQVRSAPIRIRRVLQEIGFCTPMELAHAIVRCGGVAADVLAALNAEGYVKQESARCLEVAKEIGFVADVDEELQLSASWRPIVRRFFLMDVIACHGAVLRGVADAGFLLVPGYGPFYGLKLVDVLNAAVTLAPGFAGEFKDSATLLADIQWLEEQRYVISS